MIRIDDDILMAFVDGELDELGRARVEQAAAGDPELRRRLEAQQRLRARLAAHYGPIAEEEVPERFRSMLDSEVVDLSAARARRERPAWQGFAAIAATLVLGVFAGQMLPSGGGPVAVEDGALVARGALAEALDTQLASAPAPGDSTRIGVSFASADGRLCRTFETAPMAGLACRGDGGWRLVVTSAGPGGAPAAGGYRQAGSASALVLQAAQEMMAGEPFDAEAERRARASGWRTAPDAD